ncbi:hypothetical protein [Desulfogranum japonicum]|uniref:hypothetical protein n=1 Tax=Desulfogranum japonicum TaxID=231447 RepID=UPI00041BAE10|nr:hypothetical protein [Desulfogranum japonicum]
MNIDTIFMQVQNFFAANQWAAIVVLIALALFVWKKTGLFLKCVGGLVAVILIVYVFIYLNQALLTGYDKKQEITTERESLLHQE